MYDDYGMQDQKAAEAQRQKLLDEYKKPTEREVRAAWAILETLKAYGKEATVQAMSDAIGLLSYEQRERNTEGWEGNLEDAFMGDPKLDITRPPIKYSSARDRYGPAAMILFDQRIQAIKDWEPEEP